MILKRVATIDTPTWNSAVIKFVRSVAMNNPTVTRIKGRYIRILPMHLNNRLETFWGNVSSEYREAADIRRRSNRSTGAGFK